MILGFTGTQRGMRPEQLKTVELLLKLMHGTEPWFVHGGCIGADKQAHSVAQDLGWNTEVFPSNIEDKVAKLQADVMHLPQDPLFRNHQIIACCKLLIAAPKDFEEVVRSGIWATIRYAEKIGHTILIVWPDGNIEVRHGLR